MPLTHGTKLGPYEIQSPLGAGGMGEVYRATDTKLGRDIALKVLPAEMAEDPERLARFRREAKVLAQLDHPNIVTIHSVEESDGVHFLTMQLVEGLPLDRLICAGGLPLEQIVEIASGLGDALAAAHEKGIVHRDLKPANVMVSNEGRVKVLDFGLAKDVRGSNLGDATLTSASHTQVGVVMGTPAYMSPEQTSGRPLDHRTDIFSFGVVLHEMATGRRPFEGTSSAELVSAILRDTPPSVTDSRPELPGDLARIIRRCLEKNPRHRLQTARDVSNEFRDLARLGSRPTPASSSTSTLRPAAASDSGAARADEGFWVAVLPFKHGGNNADLAALADGLTDDTITGLSKFSYLRVIARSSSSRYAGQSVDVRSAGKELSARYVMEGTLRQAVSRLRLSVQLVDTVSGAHLWAENYERAFSPQTIFELQDDLVPRIVSTVADMNGILPRSMSEGLRSRPPEQLSPYEAVLRSFAYTYSATPEELAAARLGLEEAVRKAPAYADAWAMLSFLCGQDYVHGYELQANALEIAASAARRAVALGPSNHLAYFSLGQALWSQKDYDSFRDAAERAVLLNPMDGNSVAYLGELLTYAGSAKRGMQLVERAKQLNPNHPGWYWFADFYHAYSQGDYRSAQSFALKAKLRGNPLAPMFLAAACGQLGDIDGGAKAVSDLLKFRPELPALMRKQVAKVWNPEYGERFLEGLRRAGLEIPESQKQTSRGPVSAGLVPAAPSIAVLPFANLSADPEQDYFSDGLAEEIINLLAQVPGLKVIARTSAFAFRGKEQDIRTIAEALGVSTILEGSVRRSGNRIRVTAQLIAATDGSHLWSERYDRELSDLFALQDEISAAIARALRVKLSREAAPQRYVPKLDAYEAYLKGRHQQAKVTPESLELARRCYEQASELDPAFAMAHIGLGFYWFCLAHFSRHSAHECVPRARAEIQRALEIDPSLPEAHAVLGYMAAMFDMDWAVAEKHFDFPMAKEASFGLIRPLYGWFQFWRGNVAQAIELAQRAIEEDPLEAWTRMNLHAYLQGAGRDDEALEQLKKVVELDPNQVVALVSMAMIYADKGDLPQALKIARRTYAIGPWFPDGIGVLAGLTRRNGEEVESSLMQALGSGETIGDARAHALYHLVCGEIDQGADWAEKAVEERDSSMMLYLRFVVSKGLRASHRWPKIAKMVNLPVGAQAQASTLLAE